MATRGKKTATRPIAKVKHGCVVLPPIDIIRFIENDCAVGHRVEYVGALFTLYQRDEFDESEKRRFERLIARRGTNEEKKRLESLKKD